MLEQISEVCCGIGDGSVCTLYGFQPGTVQRDRLTASACGPGFEVVHLSGGGDGGRIEGRTTTIQDGAIWAAEYAIEVDAAGATRRAAIRGRPGTGFCTARPGPTATATGWPTANPRPVRSRNDTRATPTGAAPLSKSTPDRRLRAAELGLGCPCHDAHISVFCMRLSAVMSWGRPEWGTVVGLTGRLRARAARGAGSALWRLSCCAGPAR